jgi:hypothetical protein
MTQRWQSVGQTVGQALVGQAGRKKTAFFIEYVNMF